MQNYQERLHNLGKQFQAKREGIRNAETKAEQDVLNRECEELGNALSLALIEMPREFRTKGRMH